MTDLIHSSSDFLPVSDAAFRNAASSWETSGLPQYRALNKMLPLGTMNSQSESIWSLCAQMVWGHEKAIVDSANDELNALLIFAGLFSAIVTAFLVPYYPSLTPATDLVAQTLSIISMQLNNLSFIVTSGYINSTHPLSSDPVNTTIDAAPDPDTISISALWFSALVFSLAAALIAIFVKQWLNRHAMPITSMPRQSVLVWYCRHRSFEKWGVTAIVGTVPILLQIALILFLVGLVLLLRTLNNTIFIIITTLFGILLAFSISTTVMPLFVPATADCPYKSPQALLVLFIVSWVSASALWLINGIVDWIPENKNKLKIPSWLQQFLPSVAEQTKDAEQLPTTELATSPYPPRRRSTQEPCSTDRPTVGSIGIRGRSMTRGNKLGRAANASPPDLYQMRDYLLRPYSHLQERDSSQQVPHHQHPRVMSQPPEPHHLREPRYVDQHEQSSIDQTETQGEAEKSRVSDIEGPNWTQFISRAFRIILSKLRPTSKVHRNWSEYEYDVIKTGDIAAIRDSTLLVAADAAVLNDRILFQVVQPYVNNPDHSLVEASEALLGILRNREKALYIGPALGASLDGMTVNLLERLSHDAKNATAKLPEIPPRLVDLLEKLLSLSRPAVYKGLLAFYQIYSGSSRKALPGFLDSLSLRIMELILDNVQRFSDCLNYGHFNILISYIPKMFDGDDVDIPSFVRLTLEVLLSCWDLPADHQMHIRQELRKKIRWLEPVVYATSPDLSINCNPLHILKECLEVAIKRGSHVIERLDGHIQTMERNSDGLQTEIASWGNALVHVQSSVVPDDGLDEEMHALEHLKTQMIIGLVGQIEDAMKLMMNPNIQIAPRSQKQLQGIMLEIESWQRALDYPRTTIVKESDGEDALKRLRKAIDSWHSALEDRRARIAEGPLTSSEGTVTLQWAGDIGPGWMAEIARKSDIQELKNFIIEQVERLPKMNRRMLQQKDELVERKKEVEGQLHGLNKWQSLIPQIMRDQSAVWSEVEKLPLLFLKEADAGRLYALFPDESR